MKKFLSLILTFLLIQISVNAQQISDPMKPALLIIDIQDFYFPSESHSGLVNAEPASKVAKEMLQLFRDKKQMVIHVRHKSTNGFAIHRNVEPVAGEKVITKTEVNCFQGTDLLSYLKENNINRLVIIGMQTQMCLEAAVRAGHDFGFDCLIVQDACATKDLKFGDRVVKAEDVQTSTLATLVDGGYGKVIDFNNFSANSENYLFQTSK